MGTALLFGSCSGDEGPGAEREPDLDDEFVAQREETVLGGATARFLITHDLTKEVAAEVHAAVTKSLNYGLEEACYFREILTRDEGWAKIVAESEKGEGIAGLFSQGGTGKYGLSADDITRLKEGDYQIYWPYSEYWDGETLPAVTFVPELADSIQVFYGSTGYQISDAGVEKILVDEDLLREGGGVGHQQSRHTLCRAARLQRRRAGERWGLLSRAPRCGCRMWPRHYGASISVGEA